MKNIDDYICGAMVQLDLGNEFRLVLSNSALFWNRWPCGSKPGCFIAVQGLRQAAEVLQAGGATCVRLLYHELVWRDSQGDGSNSAEGFEDFLESIEQTVMQPGLPFTLLCSALLCSALLCSMHTSCRTCPRFRLARTCLKYWLALGFPSYIARKTTATGAGACTVKSRRVYSALLNFKILTRIGMAGIAAAYVPGWYLQAGKDLAADTCL